MVLWHYLLAFSKKIDQNIKSLNVYEMLSTDLKHTQFWSLHFMKLKFPQKLSPLVYFIYSISIAWIFNIIHQNIRKDSSKNEVSKNFDV